MRAVLLRALCVILGLSIAIIGLWHVGQGASVILGAGDFSASVDSEDRFFGAIFFGYGLGWLLCATDPARWRLSLYGQSAIFLLGGLARMISLVQVGRPHDLYLYLWLMAIELVVPFVLFGLFVGLPRVTRAAESA